MAQSSEDGVAWQASALPGASAFTIEKAESGGGFFLVDSLDRQDYWISRDALTWERRKHGGFKDVTYCNEAFLAATAEGTIVAARVEKPSPPLPVLLEPDSESGEIRFNEPFDIRFLYEGLRADDPIAEMLVFLNERPVWRGDGPLDALP